MRVELIGNGLNGRLKTTEYYLKKSLSNSEFDNFIGFSAYTKKNGLNLFVKELLAAKEQFKTVKFYLGIAEKGTSKEVLEFLLEQNIETYTFCSFSDYIFHPKIYFFEGKTERRMIIGSSNLTKKGLSFDGNIEASVMIDYSISDTSGLKLQRQYFDYFDEIINATNSCVNLLTRESLDEFVEKGYVINELKTYEDGHTVSHSGSRTKKPKREKLVKYIDIQEKLEKQEKESKGVGFFVTEKYISAWDSFFETFKKYKKENDTVTVPRDCQIPGLYRWYRMQKIFYSDKSIDSTYKQKYEHIEKLKSIGFYFGDAHKLLQQLKEEEWLDIVIEALSDPAEKERMRVNHRYKFNGNRLGTFFVGLAQEIRKENPKKNKIELYKIIKDLGFDISQNSRDQKNTAKRFLDKLLNDKSPIKVDYQKYFNHTILPKADKISTQIKDEISVAWELQFNEERTWHKKSRSKDRTKEWKELRYNSIINPEGKWVISSTLMGNLWFWVRLKKENKNQMDSIVHKFNESEVIELRNEGFPV